MLKGYCIIDEVAQNERWRLMPYCWAVKNRKTQPSLIMIFALAIKNKDGHKRTLETNNISFTITALKKG
jgi:hypothetical protein